MNYLVARADKHYWEEPIVSGSNGSGTIFFSGCVLRCAFCQNHQISSGGKGVSVSESELIYLMQSLEDEGVHNINLVTPSHYARPLAHTLELAKRKISIPIVYNSGGYDAPADLKNLDGLIDIYLPDLKYYSNELAYRYSKKSDYFEVAEAAIRQMRHQQPLDIIDDKGIMQKGVIVRHLILPTHANDSKKVLSHLASVDKGLYISLMAQYFPPEKIELGELNRRITRAEYDEVVEHFFAVGLKNGFTQELDSAIEDYVPDFDLDALKTQIAKAELKYATR